MPSAYSQFVNSRGAVFAFDTEPRVVLAPAEVVEVARGVGRARLADLSPGPAGQTLSPAVAHVQLRTYAPTVLKGILIAPGTGELDLRTYAPTVVQGASVVPGAVSLQLRAYGPTVLQSRLVAPASVRLTLAAYAPSVLQAPGVAPETARMTFRTYAPTLQQGQGPQVLGSLVGSRRRVPAGRPSRIQVSRR